MTKTACFVVFLFCPVFAEAIVQTLDFQNSGLNDLQFTNNITFSITHNVRSKLDCAQRCTSDPNCTTFTYSSGWCRGHTVAVTTQSPAAPVSGARTYLSPRQLDHLGQGTNQSDWVEKPCTVDGDCHVNNSECYLGKCLCTPGYYYSIQTSTCVDNCAEGDLSSSTFLMYPESRVDGDRLQRIDPFSRENCLSTCLGDSQCRSFKHITADDDCYLYRDVVGDPDVEWEPKSRSGYEYYQRNCA